MPRGHKGFGIKICRSGRVAIRLAYYLGGLFILSFGVIFAALSGLGISPINSMPYVLSQITGVKLGSCVFAVYAVFVIAQVALKKGEIHLIDLSQLLVSALFGCFVDMAKAVLGEGGDWGYPVRFLLLIASIVFSAVGVSMYVGADLINMPADGFVQTIVTQRKQWHFGQVKQVLDCSAVVVSLVLSLVFLGRVDGIREGTVLTALLLGRMMRVIQKHLPGLNSGDI